MARSKINSRGLFVLSFYLIGQIAMPFFLGLFILLFSLSLERLLRLVDMVTANGASLSRVFPLMGTLLPHYLSVSLPAAFFLASLLAIRNLRDRSELAIIQSAGISLRSLLVPLLSASVVISAIMLLLSGYAEPFARYAYRAEVYKLSESGQFTNLQSGIFSQIGKNTTARAEEVSGQGKNLKSFFMTKTSSDESVIYITSKSAFVDRDPTTGGVTLRLDEGSLIRIPFKAAAQPVVFTHYDIAVPAEKTYGARGRDEREMTFQELAKGGIPGVAKGSNRHEEIAELNARLVQAASVPFLAMLALPLALMGSGRTGKAYGVVIGIALLILYDKVLGFGEAASAKGHLNVLLSQWLPCALLGLGSFLTLRVKIPYRLKLATQRQGSV